MNRFWFLNAFFALVFSLNSFGQKYLLQGVVRDSVNNKTIESVVAQVMPVGVTNTAMLNEVSDVRGRFAFSLPAGRYLLAVKILGYTPLVREISISSDIELEFLLSPQTISLGEVEVTSLIVHRKVRDLPTPITVVPSYKYNKLSAITLSNVLASEPGISMGNDGVWSTNINIRGFNESRLVTLIDGNRVETATDLTASLSMTDVNDIERVEVVKGAQSSLYGTGAMGGIVNIITKEGHFSEKPYFSGNIISGFASANKLFMNHADINTGSDKWYLRLSGAYGKADDIRTPEGVLPNSQFTTSNITAKVGVKPLENHIFNLQYQRNWSTDVGIPGGSAFPGPATATYTDIGRQLLAAGYEIKNIGAKLESLKLRYFLQYIQRDVALYPNTVTLNPTPTGSQRITPGLVTPIGDHFTQGGKLQSTWNLSDKNTLIAGLDLWSRKLYTERTKNITVEVLNSQGAVVKTNNLVRGETPIPESSFTSTGVFIQDESQMLDDKLTLIAGGRIDGIRVKNERGFDIDYLITNGVRNDTPPNQRITFEKSSKSSISWSANTGMLYSLFKETDLSFNLARSFRAPSLEERFKYIDLGNYVRLGNINLKPENGYSADIGLRMWKTRFTFQADIFANRILNMIVEAPGEFIYTINTGTSEGLIDTLPALVNTNVSKALLYGFDFGFQYNFYSDLVLFGTGSYVRGKDTEARVSLPQIPPLSGRLGIRYTYNKIGSAELTVVGASKQDKIAEGETETGGFTRLDLALSSTSISLGITKLQVYAGIDNITDRSYTSHLSTNRGNISVEPGRNIYLRMNLAF
ncbi:MAG TPA: TonB-dependent receptor [Bacteroidales bacterium]|jgi:hemoglobin/transferrin/lactoferrin receptor protein|nr:MAG: Colicin I receptor precursor [Bacteroidetes bacterium ADurb.Bin145]HOU03080.1 TonB-dependent receptor [Bacteroidales bacterium]HQK68503.1 TonB-dependent receptor [Bacteroidales bacterium]